MVTIACILLALSFKTESAADLWLIVVRFSEHTYKKTESFFFDNSCVIH